MDRHVRSSTLVQPSLRAEWKHTNHILQTAYRGMEGKHNPLFGNSHCQRSGKTQFSWACFSDPGSSTVVAAYTFSIDSAGLKWFRCCHGSSDHTSRRWTVTTALFLVFITPLGYHFSWKLIWEIIQLQPFLLQWSNPQPILMASECSSADYVRH